MNEETKKCIPTEKNMSSKIHLQKTKTPINVLYIKIEN